jgi:DNA-binding IclR family transcriptional regulator
VTIESVPGGNDTAERNGRPLFPRSPLRVLSMLEHIAAQPEGSSLAQISSVLEEPKTSLLALLRALVASGVLTQSGSVYQLGMRAYALGAMIGARSDFPAMAKAEMVTLSERSGETVLLSVLTPERDQALYVDRADSSNPIRYMAAIGETRPLYASAGGLMLLADMPAEEADAYLETIQLLRLTPRTIVDRAVLRQRLQEIRERGVATTDGDVSPEVAGFAAPIRDRTGRCLASIVIGAPVARAMPIRHELIELVLEAGQRISRGLGYFA